MSIPGGPVLVLGAGATKACAGPMTNEILWEADQSAWIIEREDYMATLDQFLQVVFRMPSMNARTKEMYPCLPLLMSLIDAAIDRGQPLHLQYPVQRLREVRAALEYVIFAVLQYKLKDSIPPYHDDAMGLLFPSGEPRVISLNYDIIADNVIARRSADRFPEYSCDIQTDAYRQIGKWGLLLKLHGSLNWLYCPNCHRLDVAVSRKGWGFSKALEQLYISEGGDSNDLNQRYTCHGSPCRNCQTFVRPVMITPTQKKDYRNPHIAQVWYKAEELLRTATSVVFVGYSMPADDVEVVYLMKRGLEHLPAKQITVVEYDPQNRKVMAHEVGQRYQSVFGDGIQWHTCGFASWIAERNGGIAMCNGA